MIEFFIKLLLIFVSYAFLYWTFAYALEQGKLIYQKEAEEKKRRNSASTDIRNRRTTS